MSKHWTERLSENIQGIGQVLGNLSNGQRKGIWIMIEERQGKELGIHKKMINILTTEQKEVCNETLNDSMKFMKDLEGWESNNQMVLYNILNDEQKVQYESLVDELRELDKRLWEELEEIFSEKQKEDLKKWMIVVKNQGQPPTVCPKCGESRIVRVLWNCVDLGGEDEEDVRSGRAILGNSVFGNRITRSVPSWLCLACEPRWSEVNRMALQNYEWQNAKEKAENSDDLITAESYRDKQNEQIIKLKILVERLLDDLIERLYDLHEKDLE